MVTKKKTKEPKIDNDNDIINNPENNDVIEFEGKPEINKDEIGQDTDNRETTIGDNEESIFDGLIGLMNAFISPIGIRQKSNLNQAQIHGLSEIDITNEYKRNRYKIYNDVDKQYAISINERMRSKDGLTAKQLIQIVNNSEEYMQINQYGKQQLPNAIITK